MPELPEVETIRRDLEREVLGRQIRAVSVSGTRSVRRHGQGGSFVARLEGHTLTAVQRRGKYLLCRLETGDVLVIHLGMSGQLLLAASPKEPAPPHTHVTISLTEGAELRFIDPRTFGQLFVTAGDGSSEVPELAHLGFDPVGDPMSWTTFSDLLHGRRTQLKALLMDQRFVAGIGNLYSDEILHAAGLRGDRSSATLTSQEVRRLSRAIVEVLNEAIRLRGSSLADEQYRDLAGQVGQYQGAHQVYARDGLACRRCRATIVRVKVAGRGSYFCPGCQV